MKLIDFAKDYNFKLFPWQEAMLKAIESGEHKICFRPYRAGIICFKYMIDRLKADIALEKFKKNDSFFMNRNK